MDESALDYNYIKCLISCYVFDHGLYHLLVVYNNKKCHISYQNYELCLSNVCGYRYLHMFKGMVYLNVAVACLENC